MFDIIIQITMLIFGVCFGFLGNKGDDDYYRIISNIWIVGSIVYGASA